MNTTARSLTIDDLTRGVLVPPATLTEARAHRDALAHLLAREREAAADFLLALADFDRRRGWERLGHASLFSFLHRELGLSKGAAYLRFTAARLLPRFPAVEAALRSGRLCLLWNDRSTTHSVRSFGRTRRRSRWLSSTVDHPAIRGSALGPPHNRDPSGAASHFRRGSGVTPAARQRRGLSFTWASSSVACSGRGGRAQAATGGVVAPLRCTSFPMAQMKPRSSRATAMTATFRCLPFATSFV